jgi:hypothetical protein
MIHIFISHTPEQVRRGATGYAIPGYQATVLDEDGPAVRARQGRRLAVKGPTGCKYLADERQADYVQNGWNVTGDAYLMDGDGYFFYQARTDDMIISAGYNIAGPEVEGALLAHPAVGECGVVGWPDDERGTIVKAYVVLKTDFPKGDETAKSAPGGTSKNAIRFPTSTRAPSRFVGRAAAHETGKLQRFQGKEKPMSADPAAPSWAARAKGILQWHRRQRQAGVHRRAGGLDRPGRMEGEIVRRAVPPDDPQHPRRAGRGERQAEHIVRLTWLRARPRRYLASLRGVGAALPRADGKALSRTMAWCR